MHVRAFPRLSCVSALFKINKNLVLWYQIAEPPPRGIAIRIPDACVALCPFPFLAPMLYRNYTLSKSRFPLRVCVCVCVCDGEKVVKSEEKEER